MAPRLQYRKKRQSIVHAVQLRRETEGFTYRKWGGDQRCKRGDWIVDNDGDVYTVDGEVFARTYVAIGQGAFRKVTPVWAERATSDGSIQTKEGATGYRAGDYLVFNEPDGGDGYAMGDQKFNAMYERCPE